MTTTEEDKPSQKLDRKSVHRDSVGILSIEGVRLDHLADAVGTPFYAYSSRAITNAYQDFRSALGPDIGICYAVKANGNLSIIALLAELGCGMDIVSEGELQRVVAAGARRDGVVFSGVGKARAEIEAALAAGIHQFNVESVAELELISAVAASHGVEAPVALRVNPDIDALSHDKISTGRKGDKFGISIDEIASLYPRASAMHGIRLVGLATHIGSQITDLEPYRKAYKRIAGLTRHLRDLGQSVTRLDLGGGIGIDYGSGFKLDLRDFASVIRETVGDLNAELTVEPGRRLVGEAGVLVAEVLYSKPHADFDIVIIDAAMNDLLRPAMYNAVHPAETVSPTACRPRKCRIVGPVCESSDAFGSFDHLPELSSGDLVAFLAAGAYGASMSSTYNARPLIPEVLVSDGQFAVIRRRQPVEDLLALERNPEWHSASSGSEFGVKAG
ncbi:diaminopimelate decarboxylase (plasmid) [Rhizobium sp. CB3090]|nr:diaminopimelate decarboxylase [Rhizobium sp. CB3090]WFU11905.1 diaminopimelate decarboxylase [Rhizobium sp. CB3090]